MAGVDSEEYWLDRARGGPDSLRGAPSSIRGCSRILLAAVDKWPDALQYASEALLDDPNFMSECVRKGGHALKYASDAVKAERAVALAAVERTPDALPFAAKALLEDHAFVRQCVGIHGSTLKYASDDIKAVPEVVLAALASWPDAMQFASPALRDDRQFVLKAIDVQGASLKFAAANLKGDRDVVLRAVKRDGLALEFASEACRADKLVVRTALKENAMAIRHAAASVQADPIWQRAASITAENKAAVDSDRVDEVFEGFVDQGPKKCIVSFPGAYVKQWDGLVRRCSDKSLCSACVFLPKSDPQKRHGAHAKNPDEPSGCYCCKLYGSKKDWGCRWFVDWAANVGKAVQLGMELYVVFFPGETNEGIVEWKDLAGQGENLWNKVGLGGSQKGEVAWLKHKRYAFKGIDLLDADFTFSLAYSTSAAPDLRRPRKGDTVTVRPQDEKYKKYTGKTGKLLQDDGSNSPTPYRVQMDDDPKKKVWFTEGEVMIVV